MNRTFDEFLTQPVVLDTGGPIVYLGVMTEANETGFWLDDAEVHDTRYGHATQEVYISEAASRGISPNRRRVFVLRSAVMSISKLEDVVTH